MKDHLLSTTSVTAMLESWTQNNVAFPALNETPTVEVRLLTALEKEMVKTKYNRETSVPWYGFFLNDTLVAGEVSLKKLLGRMREAGYKVRNLDELV